MSTGARVELEGALNLRDIGGYAGDGGRVRRGVVFRSDNFHTLSDADLDVIDGLGIRAVFDFRGDREVELQPSRLWAAAEHVVRVPIAGDTVQEKTFIERVESRELVEITEEEVGESYVEILEERGHQFVPVLEAIVAETHTPLVYHCTAGKDRTGLATALIHGLCGVDRSDIVADFALSNTYRLPFRVAALRERLEPQGIDVERLVPGLGAPEAAMHMALDHLDRTHGGIRGYVRSRLGIHDDTIEAIATTLIIAD